MSDIGLWNVARTSLKEHGVWKTLKAAPKYFRRDRGMQRRRDAARRRMEEEDGFDACHGTQTTSLVPRDRLGAASVKSAVLYWPVLPRTFAKMMSRIRVDYRDYVFIDLGCGMGRALLMASEFPFKRIVGVDFSRRLIDVAIENTKRYESSTQQCDQIDLQLQDATTFEFPDSPLFVFMFDPFRPPVLTRVFDNLQASLERNPRPLVLAYLLPHKDEAHLLSWLPRVHDEPGGLPEENMEYPWSIFARPA